MNTWAVPAIRSKTWVKKLYKESRSQMKRDVKVSFLLQDWEDAYNVGGLLRVADAVGCKEVFASGRTPVPPDPMISVTSIGAHRRIPVRHYVRHDDAALAAIDAGWILIGVEIAEEAVAYQTFTYPDRCCLVLGNEAVGVYASVLKHCKSVVYIPQFGKGRSMNVHVAGAVVAYRALLGSDSVDTTGSDEDE